MAVRHIRENPASAVYYKSLISRLAWFIGLDQVSMSLLLQQSANAIKVRARGSLALLLMETAHLHNHLPTHILHRPEIQ